MRIAILTFEGFNELDSFIASAMLNRVKQPELKAPVSQKQEYVDRAAAVVRQYVPGEERVAV